MNIKVELVGREAIERKLKPSLYLPAVAVLVRDASAFATTEAQRGASREAGAVAGTITATVNPMSARIGSRHPGALAAEFGRHSGTPPPPVSSLRGRVARGFEYVIARAISRHGVKGRFFLTKARQRLERVELPRLITRAAQEIERKWAA